MSKMLDSSGQYKVKETGEVVSYDYSYMVVDSIDDAIESLGADKAKSTIQRMLKVDANNLAREKAKGVNGHSARQPLTEEQKVENKVKRQADKDLLAKVKALVASGGLDLESLA